MASSATAAAVIIVLLLTEHVTFDVNSVWCVDWRSPGHTMRHQVVVCVTNLGLDVMGLRCRGKCTLSTQRWQRQTAVPKPVDIIKDFYKKTDDLHEDFFIHGKGMLY